MDRRRSSIVTGNNRAAPETVVNKKKDRWTMEREKERFLTDVKRFNENRGTPIVRWPVIGGRQIDLYALYCLVTEKGGWEKVTSEDFWPEVLEQLNIPGDCANADQGLRLIYIRHLHLFEKANHFKMDPDVRDDVTDSMDETPQSSRRRGTAATLSSLNTVCNVALSYNHQQHNLNDITREALGLMKISDQCPTGDVSHLDQSLASGLPNEVDFAFNVGLLLSTASMHTLKGSQAIRTIEAMLSFIGILKEGETSMSDLWLSGATLNFLRFWNESTLERSVKELVCPECLLTEKGSAMKNTEETEREEAEWRSDYWVNNLNRALGTQDLQGQRVTQLSTIVRNLSMEEENVELMASSLVIFRFVMLCIHNRYGSIRQNALETLANISSRIVLEPLDCRMTQLVLEALSKCLTSTDRIELVSGLESLGKLCQMEINEDAISGFVDEAAYTMMIRILTVHDVLLLLPALEAVYQLSELGHICCTHISTVVGAIDVLVDLLTIDAQLYMSGSPLSVKTVEVDPAENSVTAGVDSTPYSGVVQGSVIGSGVVSGTAIGSNVVPGSVIGSGVVPGSVIGSGVVSGPVTGQVRPLMASPPGVVRAATAAVLPSSLNTGVVTTRPLHAVVRPHLIAPNHIIGSAGPNSLSSVEVGAKRWLADNFHISNSKLIGLTKLELYRQYVAALSALGATSVLGAGAFESCVRESFPGMLVREDSGMFGGDAVYSGLVPRTAITTVAASADVPKVTSPQKLNPTLGITPAGQSVLLPQTVARINDSQRCSTDSNSSSENCASSRPAAQTLVNGDVAKDSNQTTCANGDACSINEATIRIKSEKATESNSVLNNCTDKVIVENGLMSNGSTAVPPPTDILNCALRIAGIDTDSESVLTSTTEDTLSTGSVKQTSVNGICSPAPASEVDEREGQLSDRTDPKSLESITPEELLEEEEGGVKGRVNGLMNHVNDGRRGNVPMDEDSGIACDVTVRKTLPNGVCEENKTKCDEQISADDELRVIEKKNKAMMKEMNDLVGDLLRDEVGGVKETRVGDNGIVGVVTADQVIKSESTDTVTSTSNSAVDSNPNSMAPRFMAPSIICQPAPIQIPAHIQARLSALPVTAGTGLAGLPASFRAAIGQTSIIMPNTSLPVSSINIPTNISSNSIVKPELQLQQQQLQQHQLQQQQLQQQQLQQQQQQLLAQGGIAPVAVAGMNRLVQPIMQASATTLQVQPNHAGGSALIGFRPVAQATGAQLQQRLQQPVMFHSPQAQQHIFVQRGTQVVQYTASAVGDGSRLAGPGGLAVLPGGPRGMATPQMAFQSVAGSPARMGQPVSGGHGYMVMVHQRLPGVGSPQQQGFPVPSGSAASLNSNDSSGTPLSSGKKRKAAATTPKTTKKKKKGAAEEEVVVAPTPPPLLQEIKITRYYCEWRNCNRDFESVREISRHVTKDHFERECSSQMSSVCQWCGCDGLVRQRWSLMTHLQDRHLSEQALRAAAYARLQRQQNPALQASATPSAAPPPTPVMYPQNAALHAIRRFTAKPSLSEFISDESCAVTEAPITKHVRLTSGLILRNLARYSALGRSLIRRHENHLVNLAFSNLESSSAISSCLWELQHQSQSPH